MSKNNSNNVKNIDENGLKVLMENLDIKNITGEITITLQNNNIVTFNITATNDKNTYNFDSEINKDEQNVFNFITTDDTKQTPSKKTGILRNYDEMMRPRTSTKPGSKGGKNRQTRKRRN